MAVTFINSEFLPDVSVYHHVAVGTGSRIVCVAGQVAWDASGRTVSDDFGRQAEQAYVNVGTALGAANAGIENVLKLTVYAADWKPEKMPDLLRGIEKAKARLETTAAPPVTLIGVAALDVPEHLVEIEALAIVG